MLSAAARLAFAVSLEGMPPLGAAVLSDYDLARLRQRRQGIYIQLRAKFCASRAIKRVHSQNMCVILANHRKLAAQKTTVHDCQVGQHGMRAQACMQMRVLIRQSSDH
jgi:hypothetical protein